MEPSPLEQRTVAAAIEREAKLDKQRLRALGVVHTPLALVRFGLARIEEALRRELDLSEGLANRDVQVLDPAVGTGVWLASLLDLLAGRSTAPASIQGFDADEGVLAGTRALLQPAAAALPGHFAMRAVNTLSLNNPWPGRRGVRVILGNPPWGARSLSRGLALSDAWLREFHYDHTGAPLGERRSGVLSDDYVRFFCWALRQARENEPGAVICFVTNASYLDGPVHRGMRAALAAAFDRIEVIDLGGNSLRSRGVGVDQALFPVRVGAALTLCVRKGGTRHHERARISHAELRGTRAQKEALLVSGALSVRHFQVQAPAFLFRPRPTRTSRGAAGFALHQAFPFHAEGIQTNRDPIATDEREDALIERLERIAHGELALPAAAHFDPLTARARLRQALSGPPEALVGKLAYRPFSTRYYCRVAPLCHRPRPLLARAVAASCLCLVSTRKEPGDGPWNMFALVETCADSSYLSVRSSCRTRVFPSHDPEGLPNLTPRVRDALAERIGHAPRAEDVLAYAAGILGAPGYRSTHQAALKLDYAWLPWPRDARGFAACVDAGNTFARLLRGEPVSEPTLWLETSLPLDALVSPRMLRWRGPHLLEVGTGTQIGARNARGFRAYVGHHAIVEAACRGRDLVSIAALREACERGAMWVEAERTAEHAYRLATCVGRDANAFAVAD